MNRSLRPRFLIHTCLAWAFLLAACQPPATEDTPGLTGLDIATTAPTATREWFPATATPTVYLAEAATPTPPVDLSYGGVLVEEDFTGGSGWQNGSYPSGNVAFGNGTLNLAVGVPLGYLSSYRSDTYFSDMYWEVTITPNLCSPADKYGLIFWSAGEASYLRLAFNCRAEFAVESVKKNRAISLLDWTSSSQLPRGGMSPFRVGLWVGGGLVRVFINDIYQSGVYLAPGTGGIGIFAESSGGPALNISYADMQVYAVSPVDYLPSPTPTLKPSKTPLPTRPSP